MSPRVQSTVAEVFLIQYLSSIDDSIAKDGAAQGRCTSHERTTIEAMVYFRKHVVLLDSWE